MCGLACNPGYCCSHKTLHRSNEPLTERYSKTSIYYVLRKRARTFFITSTNSKDIRYDATPTNSRCARSELFRKKGRKELENHLTYGEMKTPPYSQSQSDSIPFISLFIGYLLNVSYVCVCVFVALVLAFSSRVSITVKKTDKHTTISLPPFPLPAIMYSCQLTREHTPTHTSSWINRREMPWLGRRKPRAIHLLHAVPSPRSTRNPTYPGRCGRLYLRFLNIPTTDTVY